MKKDPKVFLQHISECIELIEDYIKEQTFQSFKDSIQLQDSLIRRLEIIGEAIKNLPEDLKKKHPEVSQTSLAGQHIIIRTSVHQVFLKLLIEITCHVPNQFHNGFSCLSGNNAIFENNSPPSRRKYRGTV